MTKVFNRMFISGNELLFWLFVILMIIIILITIYWVLKEVKHESK